MRAPERMVRVVNRKRYSVEKATLLAHDAYWDGNSFERSGRNMFLYRTQNGSYFVVHRTQWSGERDHLRPVTVERAIALYEGPLTEHEVDYEQAFPCVEVQDA